MNQRVYTCSIIIGLVLGAQEHVYAQEVASKGALTEALFIVQNKAQKYKEHAHALEKLHEKACLSIKQLPEKKATLVQAIEAKRKHFEQVLQAQKMQGWTFARQQKIEALEDELEKSIHEQAQATMQLHHAQSLKECYPEYKKQLSSIIDDIDSDIQKICADPVVCTFSDLKKYVEKAYLTCDICTLHKRILQALWDLDAELIALERKQYIYDIYQKIATTYTDMQRIVSKIPQPPVYRKKLTQAETVTKKLQQSIAQKTRAMQALCVELIHLEQQLAAYHKIIEGFITYIKKLSYRTDIESLIKGA